jgi:KDO2-lipid IV(A) lauroyltransferase
MYYLVYGILYLFSLLPLRVLYLFSDLAFWYLYRVKKYRRGVVMQNLSYAFPEKTEEERTKIARDFYQLFTDTFIETIKLISMSDRQVNQRGKCEVDYINELIEKGYNIHILAGHQFNWEFANLLYARHLKIPFVGVYAPIANKALNRVFLKMRARNGTIMVSARDFTSKMHEFFRSQYVLALAADQNPSKLARSYWVNFLGRPAPFVTGPGKGAVKNNTAVVYVGFERVKRGQYAFRTIPITDNGMNYTPEQLTVMYKKALEAFIRDNPSNYLWSHRRWRHEWKPEYGPVIDDAIAESEVKQPD